MLEQYPTIEATRAALAAEHPGAQRLPGLSALYAIGDAYFDPKARMLIAFFDNTADSVEPCVFVNETRARDLLYSPKFLWFFNEGATMKTEDPERYWPLYRTSLDELVMMLGADASLYNSVDNEPCGDLETVLEAAERDHSWGVHMAQELTAHMKDSAAAAKERLRGSSAG
jgi:hypothetical protein